VAKVNCNFGSGWNGGRQLEGCGVQTVKFDTVTEFGWIVVIVIVNPDVFVDVAEDVCV
jgi:hypothetical protein